MLSVLNMCRTRHHHQLEMKAVESSSQWTTQAGMPAWTGELRGVTGMPDGLLLDTPFCGPAESCCVEG
jgi:hypothetical protein